MLIHDDNESESGRKKSDEWLKSSKNKYPPVAQKSSNTIFFFKEFRLHALKSLLNLCAAANTHIRHAEDENWKSIYVFLLSVLKARRRKMMKRQTMEIGLLLCKIHKYFQSKTWLRISVDVCKLSAHNKGKNEISFFFRRRFSPNIKPTKVFQSKAKFTIFRLLAQSL